MAPRQSAATQMVYQLKITLQGAKPPIWRRVQILNTVTLEELHYIIQQAMGWMNCHLHEFVIQGIRYSEPMPNHGFNIEFNAQDESKFKLNQLVKKEKFKFLYTYDMGDSWDHEILVEKILPQDVDQHYPVCLKGKRACPPEDCGGIWGYAEFIAAIQDPNHPEHEEMLEWVGGDFDPDEFDIDEVNQRLNAMF